MINTPTYPVRTARAREEMQFLAGELSAAVGLGGRDRAAGFPAERARVSITKAVKIALARIRAHSPAPVPDLTGWPPGQDPPS